MATSTDKKVLERNIFSILSETRASAVAQNIAEKFLVPFALIMKASSSSIAVLSALPQLLGALTQLYSVKVLHRFSSRKKVIALFLFFQALLWLPLFLIPLLFPSIGIISLMISYSLYHMAGGFFNPAWSSWIVHIVPENARGRFFGKKNQTAGRAGFLAASLGGYLLSVLADIHIWLAYAILFAFAFLGKLLCAVFVLRMKEDDEIKRFPAYSNVTFFDFLKHIRETFFGQYVLYMCCMSFAVNIATPYFTPYMLHSIVDGGLGFSYLQFTIISALGASAGFLVFRHWGKISDRFGNKKVLVFTGFLVPFVPLFWLFSPNFYYLLLIEFFSGLVWAGFNLTTSNYVFDFVGTNNRAIYAAYYSVLTTIAVFIGALTGSLFYSVGHSLGFNGIQFIFGISFLLRFAVVLFFFTKLRELREVEGYHFFHELALRPMQGFGHGTVQYIRDSFVHFKRKHMRDIVKVERYLDGKE